MTKAYHHYESFSSKFHRMNLLGEGSFGKVFLAKIIEQQPIQQEIVNKQNQNNMNLNKQHFQHFQYQKRPQTAKYYALKKLKPYITKKNMGKQVPSIQQYPEVQIHKKIKHINLMHMHSILEHDKQYEINHYLVFDYGVELSQLYKHQQLLLTSQQIKWIAYQIILGIQAMHGQGYMHRDIKSSNIYFFKNGEFKLGDFSISRPFYYQLPHSQTEQKTANVTTRWYRAPQILFGSKIYDQSIDIWGLGCTLAELLVHQPLFQGQSEINQLQIIFSIVGYPQDLWPQAKQLPFYLQYDNTIPCKGLENILPNKTPQLLDLIQKLLTLDPKKRPSVKQLKQHIFFKDMSKNGMQQLQKICSYLYDKSLNSYVNAYKK